MEKSEWLDFLSARLKSQISIETAQRTQTWILAVFGLGALGFALGAVSAAGNSATFYSTKVLFLIFQHAFLVLMVYLPSILQKGEKPLARLFGTRDFFSLTAVSIAIAFYAVVTTAISFHVAAGIKEANASPFFALVAVVNALASIFYLGAVVCYFAGLIFFPSFLVKAMDCGTKAVYFFISLHASLFLLMGLGYSEIVPVGSANFFEEFRVAGLFWIFILSSLVLIGKSLQDSAIPSLAALQFEMVSGKLNKHEDILLRFKDAFLSRRLVIWMHHLAHSVATRAHEIAGCSHDAVNLVSSSKPTEIDLRQVEDRYHRADVVYHKLEKENQKFLLSTSFFDLTEAEREKIETVKDLFSRELRHAKIELAGVRKRIDEKLSSLKESQVLASSGIPVEQVPLSR